MINRIYAHTETSGLNKVITKCFQRGLQQIDTKSAYIDNKLYFRAWVIREFGKLTKYSQVYFNGAPFKDSRSKIDYYT